MNFFYSRNKNQNSGIVFLDQLTRRVFLQYRMACQNRSGGEFLNGALLINLRRVRMVKHVCRWEVVFVYTAGTSHGMEQEDNFEGNTKSCVKRRCCIFAF